MKPIPVRSISTPTDGHLPHGFNIRDVRDILAGKDMVQELHRHDFFYVLALEKGAGHHEIDFVKYDIGDHVVFFMRPGQVHQLTLKARSRGYLMEFRNDFYHPRDKAAVEMLRKASNKSFCQVDAGEFKKLFNILMSVFQEFSARQEGYEEVIKASLGIFLITLVRHRKDRKPSSTKVPAYAQEQLEKLSAFLETHIATHKQVAEYADMMNLSLYQVNAITKATLGKTCSEVIDDYIILESKRYLLATTNQVNQIADQLGYDDVSYFIRFFRKHTGHSPEAFRQNFG